MPRRIRRFLPETPQLVCQRGNNNQCFFVDDSDYANYLDYLNDAAYTHECAIHAYVLLPNHAFLLLTPARDNSISTLIQLLGRRYVPHFNGRHRRTGVLWESRYRACLVDAETSVLDCMIYIDTLPLRSGLARQPDDYVWSSYRYHVFGDRSRLIKAHACYLRLGQSDGTRRSAYQHRCATPMDCKTLNVIEEATRRCLALSSCIPAPFDDQPPASRPGPGLETTRL